MLISAQKEITYSSNRWPTTPARRATTRFRKRHRPHPEVLQKVSRESALYLRPLHTILLPLHVIHLSLCMLPNPAGLRLRPHGKTWICPRGGFRKTLSNGWLLTWRTSRPSTTGWSTSPEDRTKPETTAAPETSSESWLRGQTGRSSTRQKGSSNRSRRKTRTSTRRCPLWLRS